MAFKQAHSTTEWSKCVHGFSMHSWVLTFKNHLSQPCPIHNSSTVKGSWVININLPCALQLSREKHPLCGEWPSFSTMCFYVNRKPHSWHPDLWSLGCIGGDHGLPEAVCDFMMCCKIIRQGPGGQQRGDNRKPIWKKEKGKNPLFNHWKHWGPLVTLVGIHQWA